MSSTPRRPAQLDIRSKSAMSVSRPLRSPRLHVAGEAPPELSPLDAFAMQSRLLAKQLEESARQGRRLSRLPPLTTDSPLIVQGRSEYFRSLSQDSGSDEAYTPQHNVGLGLRHEVDEDVSNRPKSMHPRMSRIPPTPIESSVPMPARPNLDAESVEGEISFGIGARREESPQPLDRSPEIERRSASAMGTRESMARSPPSAPTLTRAMTSPEHVQGGLLPPRPLFPKRSSSMMSSPLEPTDEDGLGSLGTSFHSQVSQGSRKMSTSSSILSPMGRSQRSPSIASDMSGLQKPSMNFSMPMSRAETPSFEFPARQPSSDSHASFVLVDNEAHTPVSMNGDGFPDPDGNHSFHNVQFTLPRGKSVRRAEDERPEFGTPLRQVTTNEQPPLPTSNELLPRAHVSGQLPPSPSSSVGPRLSEDRLRQIPSEQSKVSLEVPRSASTRQPSPEAIGRLSTDSALERARPSTSPTPDSNQNKTATPTATPTSTAAPSIAATHDTAATLTATRSLGQATGHQTMAEMTAEEHVSKAVALHEKGALQESTWHLRHAAKQGHPTGMLLYALACRHGWGMRPNQREGVEWLRKAAASVNLELQQDDDKTKEGKSVDKVEHKARKAQFALALYELGVSHMNGWGIEQDKVLALRCFEIAGSWGDVDALAEAGFCYAQGIGCKKNLKKSAKYYREAEAKGMSMVGNSWIHKPKYADDPKDGKDSKHSRNKSKSRKTLFGWNHS
ncbi:hypothetical protein NEUTE1DRAFT_127007 [Neurospora tetrasperma FGSC 2508]|uniref:HCP-like protein n=1 Tax=Neurospora tetrasperma (strain FGSC 2508 / ATCC MYA-4615 / P0657) TaxID=510951 RepID=F8N054_NEUT8|nr:uncharacterized protein NEUTE1DRAFT_127007 [Neurospora tetrasperma FGSC 2508]EGO53789.1 hypothetical protein NEUTE1DRAFT_127007 [Neurospora tetrasperma FGSC 2508]EGZ76128.1 hypothetical protein NEUTE2DRAFT_153149 [Neurospora tetrasperma FGSC 2509]